MIVQIEDDGLQGIGKEVEDGRRQTKRKESRSVKMKRDERRALRR